jgi:hypothetical protein
LSSFFPGLPFGFDQDKKAGASTAAFELPPFVASLSDVGLDGKKYKTKFKSKGCPSALLRIFDRAEAFLRCAQDLRPALHLNLNFRLVLTLCAGRSSFRFAEA